MALKELRTLFASVLQKLDSRLLQCFGCALITAYADACYY